VGDFGGGGALLAFGVLAGLLETSHSGKGQVVDAAMVDGAALLATMIHSFRALGWWTDERGTNLLDTGAPFYEVYETKDNKWISVGAIEPQFYAQLIERLGLDQDDSLPPQMDRSHWPEMKKKFAAIFKTKTRDEWCKVMEDVDACFAPVLSMAEAPKYPHNRDREVFIESDGVVQPAAAPRFSRTPSSAGPLERSSGESLPKKSKEAVFDMLSSWGFDLEEVTRLVNNNVIA
jgi:alpha-methylacyl-CoA racemase